MLKGRVDDVVDVAEMYGNVENVTFIFHLRPFFFFFFSMYVDCRGYPAFDE